MPSRHTPTEQLRLDDGRVLDLWHDNRPDEQDLTPLLFHAGTPGSGLGFGPFLDAARRRGLRIISWSRPATARRRGCPAGA